MEINLTSVFFVPIAIRIRKRLLLNMMKIAIFLCCLTAFSFTPNIIVSQNAKVTINADKTLSVDQVFDLIMTQTDYRFIYQEGIFNSFPKVELKKGTIKTNDLLKKSLAGGDFNFDFTSDNTIIIKEADSPLNKNGSQSVITGTVINKDDEPIPGVTVLLKGTNRGTSTDFDGNFKFNVQNQEDHVLVFSYIGMITKEVKVSDNKVLTIVMEESSEVMDEVVITGYVDKPKESFTGAATSITGSELLSVGNSNLLESLQAFVPGLLRVENIDLGSDPNALPEIIIRGRSSFSGSTSIPTFIIDGAEVTLEDVFDIDLSYIEQVTVLKDAAAASLYGSKAANGVIVITTKKIKSGKIMVAYNASMRFNGPDLTDYNLLDARDKLEYERLAGLYTSQYGNGRQQYTLDNLYNEKLQRVNQGVNTNWIAKPLRIGITHDHSLRFYGGSENTRYSLNARIGNDEGVMKTAFRQRQSLNFVLSHNINQKIFVQNTTSVNFVNSQNSKYGEFNEYVRLNPYDRPTTLDGETLNNALSYGQRNPLREAQLGSYNRAKRFNFRNVFDVKWNILEELQLQGNIAMTKGSSENTNFLSPDSKNFEGRILEEKGSIAVNSMDESSLQGRLIGSYTKTFKEGTLLIASLGSSFQEDKGDSDMFRAIGFLSDNLSSPQWALKYPENERPGGSQDVSRLLGYFLNLNYIYDNRYYADFSYRYEGSSKFGSENRFAPFWSIGAGWNIHKESFLEGVDAINILRLRSSYGLLGNASFSPYQALTTYQYSVDNFYKHGVGANPITIGNDRLSWERTLNYNLGLEVGLFNGKVKVDVDWYKKVTNDLLLDVTKAPSVGVESAKENLGKINNSGLELSARVMALRNDLWEWSINLTASHNKNKIVKIGEALKKLNEKVNASTEGEELRRLTPFFEEGESLSAVKLVKSGGIDPATGKEVYIDRFGNPTFIYDFKDKILYGDSQPDVYGVIGTYIKYKGLSLDVKFDYSLGATVYNSTLVV